MKIAAAAVLLSSIPALALDDVVIQNFAYLPADLTVVVGTTLRWTNFDAIEHTATSQTGPGTLVPSGVFDSGLLMEGQSFEFTFTQPGVYHYWCVPHGSSMQGVIRVTAAATCYPNCDGSSGSPLLTANDFQCFINRFAAGESYANCDGSTGTPSLTANDFQCFLNAFAAGCS
jgi:plastocyanin